MTRCPTSAEIEAYRAGALDPTASRNISLHLQHCEHCSQMTSQTAGESFSQASGPLEDQTWNLPVPMLVDQVVPPTAAYSHGSRTAGKRPVSEEFIDSLQLPDRYELIGEIARGGMGCVLKVRDRNLRRELAVKTLLPRVAGQMSLVERFQGEAEITGSLQHPGIPPVVEVGRLGNGNPFFSMKLVNGDTLAQLLTGRTSPLDRLDDFIEIFQSVSQTIAYAHSRRIIHRDLKPHNVMVGAFGEVQVMDWGLAKSLDRDDEESVGDDVPGSGSETSTGTVLGTLGYMSPEQAWGDRSQVDQRADVYGLGSILCCILTGSPPYTAAQHREAIAARQISPDQTALELADTTKIPEELVSLARQCLAPVDRRLGDAGEVAAAVESYVQSSAERARRAEVEAAEQKAKVESERRRFRSQLIAAVAVLGAVTALLVGGGWLWIRETVSRASRDQELSESLNNISADFGKLLQDPSGNESVWLRTRDQLTRANAVVQSGSVDGELATELRQTSDQFAQLEKDRKLFDSFTKTYFESGQTVLGHSNDWDLKSAMQEYREAVLEYGINWNETTAEEFSKFILQRPEAIRRELIVHLGVWFESTVSQNGGERTWLHLVLQSTDTDKWRLRLWDALLDRDYDEVSKLLKDDAAQQQPPSLIVVVCRSLKFDSTSRGDVLRRVLTRLHEQQPSDFWLNMTLGQTYLWDEPKDYYRATNYYAAAIATSQSNAIAHREMAVALNYLGRREEAIASLRKAISISDTLAVAKSDLARMLAEEGQFDEAITLAVDTIELVPWHSWAYHTLAIVLQKEGREDWIDRFDDLVPSHASKLWAATGLAAQLDAIGQTPLAIEVLQKATPNTGKFSPLVTLGTMLRNEKRHDEAIAVFQQAIEIGGGSSGSHQLAITYAAQDRHDLAVETLRELVKANPDDIPVLQSLVSQLYRAGKSAEAIDLTQKLAKRWPDEIWFVDWLGFLYSRANDLKSAAEVYRSALEIDPDHQNSLLNLSRILRDSDQQADAIRLLEEAVGRQASTNVSLELGNLYETAGRREDAIRLYTEMLRRNPAHQDPLSRLVNILYQRSEHHKAIRRLENAIEVQESVPSFLQLAASQYAIGRLDEASQSYERILQLDPDHKTVPGMLLNALFQSNRRSEAMQRAQQILDARPRDADMHCWVGFLYQQQGDFDKSMPYLTTALEIDPRHDNALFDLANTWIGKGRDDEAANCYIKLLDRSPEYSRIDALPTAVTLMTEAGHWDRARDHALRLAAGELSRWKQAAQNDFESAWKGDDSRPDRWLLEPALGAVRHRDALRILPEDQRQCWTLFWNDVCQQVTAASIRLGNDRERDHQVLMLQQVLAISPTDQARDRYAELSQIRSVESSTEDHGESR